MSLDNYGSSDILNQDFCKTEESSSNRPDASSGLKSFVFGEEKEQDVKVNRK